MGTFASAPCWQKGEGMGNYEAIFNLIGSILGGVIIGAFCGAISLIVGIIKKKKALGLIGFFVSIAFGIFMTTVLYQPAFLSIIPSAIFAGIIFILTITPSLTCFIILSEIPLHIHA